MDDPSPPGDPGHHSNKDYAVLIRVADAEQSLAGPSLAQTPTTHYTPDVVDGSAAASVSANVSDLNPPGNDSTNLSAGSGASHSTEPRRSAPDLVGAAQRQPSQCFSGSGAATVCASPSSPDSFGTLSSGGNAAQPGFYRKFRLEPPPSDPRALLASQTGCKHLPADAYDNDSLLRLAPDTRGIPDGSRRLMQRFFTAARLSSPSTTFLPQRSPAVSMPLGSISTICFSVGSGQISPSSKSACRDTPRPSSRVGGLLPFREPPAVFSLEHAPAHATRHPPPSSLALPGPSGDQGGLAESPPDLDSGEPGGVFRRSNRERTCAPDQRARSGPDHTTPSALEDPLSAADAPEGASVAVRARLAPCATQSGLVAPANPGHPTAPPALLPEGALTPLFDDVPPPPLPHSPSAGDAPVGAFVPTEAVQQPSRNYHDPSFPISRDHPSAIDSSRPAGNSAIQVNDTPPSRTSHSPLTGNVSASAFGPAEASPDRGECDVRDGGVPLP